MWAASSVSKAGNSGLGRVIGESGWGLAVGVSGGGEQNPVAGDVEADAVVGALVVLGVVGGHAQLGHPARRFVLLALGGAGEGGVKLHHPAGVGGPGDADLAGGGDLAGAVAVDAAGGPVACPALADVDGPGDELLGGLEGAAVGDPGGGQLGGDERDPVGGVAALVVFGPGAGLGDETHERRLVGAARAADLGGVVLAVGLGGAGRADLAGAVDVVTPPACGGHRDAGRWGGGGGWGRGRRRGGSGCRPRRGGRPSGRRRP